MELHDLSIRQIVNSIKEKQFSADDVVASFTKNMQALNAKYNAYISVINNSEPNPKFKKGALYGIPFSIKDVYMTEGIEATAGSEVLKGYVPQYNATVYKKLISEGAVLVAKGNCDQWGHGSSTENSAFGPSKNPWNPEYVPGGSSGGDAAGLALNLAKFAIVEDTGGSIGQPACFCGVVGLRVTYGLVSRFGNIPYVSSLDTVGPMTKTVEDCATVLEIIAGNDPLDATTTPVKKFSYLKEITKDIKGLKIGIPKEYFIEGTDEQVRTRVEEAVKVFTKLGAQIIDISLPMTQYAVATYYLIAASETSSNLARYTGVRYGNDRSKFSNETKRRLLLGTYILSKGYYDKYYVKATKMRRLIRDDFLNNLKKVDVILAPVSPVPPFKIGEMVDDPLAMYLIDIFTVTRSLAGIPSLALPAGLTDNGLPVGFQLLGKPFDEARLLNAGYAYEQEVGGFPSPEIK